MFALKAGGGRNAALKAYSTAVGGGEMSRVGVRRPRFGRVRASRKKRVGAIRTAENRLKTGRIFPKYGSR